MTGPSTDRAGRPVAHIAVTIAAVACVGGVVVSACGAQQQETSPAPTTPAAAGDVVTFPIMCGPQQVYWNGSWWTGHPPLQHQKGNGPERELEGTMRATGPGRAVLESDGLTGPQPMDISPAKDAGRPPLPLCRF